MSHLLIVMGKASVPGRVKTRLTPPLDAEQAARVNGALIRATLRNVVHSAWDVELHLAGRPEPGDGLESIPVSKQTGADLGERMLSALKHGFEAGHRSVVLIGSDHPTVPPAHVEMAFSALDSKQGVVLGPSEDGGYYLVGMTRPIPELFERMTWSVDTVFAETRRRAMELAVSVTILPVWYDVDREADLNRLRGDLLAATSPDAELLSVLEDMAP